MLPQPKSFQLPGHSFKNDNVHRYYSNYNIPPPLPFLYP